MSKLILESKAKTLEKLSRVICKAKVLPVFRFNALHYRSHVNVITNKIKNKFNQKLIIRSSSANEDNLETSFAGGFDSVLNVDSNDICEIQKAIDTVLDSYGQKVSEQDEIFVQPMLKNVTMSGVIFTADLDTLSSYYIINYDESGSTTSVTSGEGKNLKTFISLKNNQFISDPLFKRLIESAKECEDIFSNSFLDIEFAVSNDEIYIFQVRAIVTNNKENLSSINLQDGLRKLNKKIDKLNAPHPNLLGNKTIFGVMPDWNPAEIIGIRPKRLALSLYKELITDETWAYQRDNYGYRNLRSHPLLVSFLGVPFIDVRISFNSFIPKELDEHVADKLVNYYLNQLSKNINHHDKVEFEIIFSCYYFGLKERLNKLKEFYFSDLDIEKIENSLLNLTNQIIDVNDGLYKKDLEKVEKLKDKFESITTSELQLIDKIYWLIKDVKRYGTLPFAGIARAGFIAVQMLKSFVSENILTENEYNSFLNSLNTVSKQMSIDLINLNKEEFLKNYGHLRPGTYDILSDRYDESYDTYFGTQKHKKECYEKSFEFSKKQKQKIEELIKTNKLYTDFEGLITFIKESIEGREYAKFLFTRHLSQVISYISEFGKKFEFSKNELANLDIQKILNLYSTLDHRDVKDILSLDIEKNKEFFQYTKAIKLPSVIVNSSDIYNFSLETHEANFITLNKIEASIILEDEISTKEVAGKIVCIRAADPGYDYLFSKNIGGLITCYGGANSHMAIRCAEMSIPAVIGCGESKFEEYTTAQNIEIDAGNKQVKVLS